MKISFCFIALFSFTLMGALHSQNNNSFNYLALGDSYTKGQNVCDSCGFPKQLKVVIEEKSGKKVNLKQIAETGWTTANLLNATETSYLNENYDLVTLLIGVNNQYQGLAFSKFKRQFPKIIDTAIAAAQGDAKKVIVLSIPDYAYTPSTYGANNQNKVTLDINKYNEHVALIAHKRGAFYIDITELTRLGIADPTLVANDGLHPSKQAYSRFVDEIYYTAKNILQY